MRKILILIHRYLGIALSLLFVLWFLSGIGMIFAKGEMPGLTQEMRFLRLPAIDISRIRLTPADAAARVEQRAGRVALGSMLDRPVYRFGGRGGLTIVYADNGAVLEEVDADMAKAIAAAFMNAPVDHLRETFVTEADQWTVGQRRQLPLHKIGVDDDARTELYISPDSGDVVLLTTRSSRALAWVATIPHWLYFTPLRTNDRLWTRIIIWSSAIGCLLAVIGIALGFLQFRWSKLSRSSGFSSRIPYSGLMRWHYITGAVFGLFTLTWVFSGLLSMDPWEWISGEDLRVRRDAFTDGPLDLAQYPAFDAMAWTHLLDGRAAKEIEFARIQGVPYYVVRDAKGERLLFTANPLQARRELFGTDSLLARLKRAVPDAHVIESELLTKYDSYYYARDERRPLPVLRAKFDDPKGTWVYIDPMIGQVAGQLHRGDRIQRWLYKGFHSLDFSFWYYSPVWDFGMIALNLGGAIMSGLGMWVGFRRLARAAKRLGR